VREIMTTEVICVSSRQSVDACMKLMTEHRVRHIPVSSSTTTSAAARDGMQALPASSGRAFPPAGEARVGAGAESTQKSCYSRGFNAPGRLDRHASRRSQRFGRISPQGAPRP
jgi:CBS domain-containing protein